MAKSSLPASTTSPDSRLGSSSIWPYIEASILDEVLAHRTTIVFVNSRGLCEKLTARLNELYAATGQVGFRVTQRVDGRLIQTEGLKCLVMKSA